jgi:hypothetical protein
MQVNTVNAYTINSLETLVVQQLAEVLKEEQLLAEKYRALESQQAPSVAMDHFSDELSRFEQRANRLYRLMTAMENSWPSHEADGSASIPVA